MPSFLQFLFVSNFSKFFFCQQRVHFSNILSKRHKPLFAITFLCGIMAIFKSYPSIGDASLYLALVPIHDEILKCKLYIYIYDHICINND